MSGGHFDGDQNYGNLVAAQIDKIIKGEGIYDEAPYSEAILEKFRETSHTLRQAAEMAQRVDWLVSGDDGEESFLRRWEEEVREYYPDREQVMGNEV